MADTTTSNLDNLLSTYYDKRFMERLDPKLYLYEWAEKRPIPKHEGKSIVFNAWRSTTGASSLLSEGTPPTAFALSSRRITATLVQIGRVAKITDFVDMTAVSPVVEGALEVLSLDAKRTYERYLQQILWRTDQGLSSKVNFNSAVLSGRMSSQLSGTKFNGGTAEHNDWGFKVMFGTSVGRLSAVDKNSINVSAMLSKSSISRVVAKLRDLDCEPLLNGAYILYTDDYAARDLTNADNNGWVDAMRYADPQMIIKGEVGKIGGVRVFTSSIVPKYRVAAHSASLSLIFGKGAFGVTEVDGAVKIIVKPMDNPYDKTDTLNQYATVGYKWTVAAAVLNDSCGRILITHATNAR